MSSRKQNRNSKQRTLTTKAHRVSSQRRLMLQRRNNHKFAYRTRMRACPHRQAWNRARSWRKQRPFARRRHVRLATRAPDIRPRTAAACSATLDLQRNDDTNEKHTIVRETAKTRQYCKIAEQAQQQPSCSSHHKTRGFVTMGSREIMSQQAAPEERPALW